MGTGTAAATGADGAFAVTNPGTKHKSAPPAQHHTERITELSHRESRPRPARSQMSCPQYTGDRLSGAHLGSLWTAARSAQRRRSAAFDRAAHALVRGAAMATRSGVWIGLAAAPTLHLVLYSLHCAALLCCIQHPLPSATPSATRATACNPRPPRPLHKSVENAIHTIPILASVPPGPTTSFE